MEEQPESPPPPPPPPSSSDAATVSTKRDEDDEDHLHHHHERHAAGGDVYVDHSTLSTSEAAKLMHGLNLKADESVVSAITDHASLECPSTTTATAALPSMLDHTAGGSSSSQEVPRQVILADKQHQQESPLPDDDVAENERHHRHHQTPSDIPVSSSYASSQDDGAAEAAPAVLLVSETPVAASSATTAAAAAAAGDVVHHPPSSPSTDVPRTIQATSSPQRGGGEHHRSISMTHEPSPQRGEHLRSVSMTEGMPLAPKAVTPAAASSPQKTEEQKDHLDEDDATDENAEGRDRYGYQHQQDVFIQSPEIQNAIVERSPGSRYVRFMEKLGSGASKDVYRAYDTQEGIEVAWNVVTLSGVPKTERNRIVNEVRLLERLHHHNIISFHGSWVNRERQEVNFVTEILSSGTLKSFINKVQVIRWKIAKRWGVQILKGLEYLHSQQPPVIHRDLKCENIFINGTSGDLRIGDLGLSTVHRNGRVLSVLGTPEFMAPDMYEEGTSYDEKVDIYAFGMVMLEIFTKQIPYSECSNPAQIYKKVSSGETPEILSRLQSRHAREFIMLCLGHRDESSGKFVRPSASELLQHPFLERRPTDDDEVVVEKPLRERAIVEQAASSGGGGGDSLNASPDATPSSKRNLYASDQQGGGGGGSNNNNNNNSTSASRSLASNSATNSLAAATPPPPRRKSRLNSFEDDDDGDRFDEMPESETNMKKVKVLMGRGQELKEDDDVAEPSVAAADSRPEMDDSSNAPPPPPPPPHQPLQHHAATTTAGDASNAHQAQQTQQQQQQQPQDQQTQYLVAAAVIENEAMIVRPYADDILKLVVTLPVEGQTQNVQFDFHLVLDDPVQVAKEMVRELGIPQAAVLEISETISGLACAARMKQDKHNQLQQQQQQLRQQQQQHLIPQAATSTSQGNVQTGSQQEIPLTVSQVSSASPIPDYSANAVSVGNAPTAAHLKIPDASIAAQNQAGPPPPVYAPPPQSVPYTTAPAYVTAPEQQVATQQYGQTQVSASGASQAPLQNTTVTAAQPQGSSVPATHSVHGLPPPAPAAPQQSPTQTVVGVQRAAPPVAPATNHVTVSWQQQQQQQQQQPEAPPQAPPAGSSTPPQGSRLEHEMTVTFQQDVERIVPLRTRSHSSAEQSPRSTPKTANGVAPVDFYGTDDSDSDDDADDELNEELRKLEEDFHKNLERTKKVFDSRMDNLARSQIEREAQHLKTLEKHEKERAEFEKRRAIEEEQQQRRLEQLQKEWDKKRETLAQHKRKHHGHMTGGGTDQESQAEQQQHQKKTTTTPLAPKNGSHYSSTTTEADSHERPPLGIVTQKPGNPSRNISTASAASTTSTNANMPSPSYPVESKHQHSGGGQAPNGGLDR